MSYWAWVCNSQWQGTAKTFTLRVPSLRHVMVQDVKFNPRFMEIEISGYIKPDNNIGSQYNDPIHPQRTSIYGRPQSNGGADGKAQPSKPQADGE